MTERQPIEPPTGRPSAQMCALADDYRRAQAAGIAKAKAAFFTAIAELEAERDALRETLRQRGRHASTCRAVEYEPTVESQCDCGLAAALAGGAK